MNKVEIFPESKVGAERLKTANSCIKTRTNFMLLERSPSCSSSESKTSSSLCGNSENLKVDGINSGGGSLTQSPLIKKELPISHC